MDTERTQKRHRTNTKWTQGGNGKDKQRKVDNKHGMYNELGTETEQRWNGDGTETERGQNGNGKETERTKNGHGTDTTGTERTQNGLGADTELT